jgi:mono/diheme cytochrome c family protein
VDATGASRRGRAAALLLFAILLAPGCAGVLRLSGRNTELERALAAAGPEAAGLARFMDDDFGNLEAYTGTGTAAPWKLYSTALLIAEAPPLGLPVEASSLGPVLERYGFLFPEAIVNLPDGIRLKPTPNRPLGQAVATMRSRIPGVGLEMRTVSCAGCHAGVLYDAQGRPTRRAWLGAPNTSIDFQGYGRAVVAGLRQGMRDERAFLVAIEQVHPGLGRGERLLYRKVVLPRVRRALRTSLGQRDQPLAFDAGGPGSPNALAILKSNIGLIPPAGFDPREVAVTSTPALWSRAFRSSLLCDGAYGVPGEPRFREVSREEATPERAARLAATAAFFTLTAPSLLGDDRGPVVTASAVARVVEALRGMASVEPPPFPGPVDGALAAAGRGVYEQRCAPCHGAYTPGPSPRLAAYPNRRVAQERWDTDASRWAGVDDAVLAWRDSRPAHAFARHVDLERTGGYVAPILDGVWITAPYLHNGSVPTLYHLMHPDERPARFEVGGHALDYARMGIALVPSNDGTHRFPEGSAPWARPVVRDTSRPGLSNSGHRQPFADMSETEKRAVLEFLKTL